MNTHPHIRPLTFVYPLFVLGVAALYVVLAVVPYFATGIHHYPYREVADQTVPGYPYGTAVQIGAIFALLYVPFLSLFPGMLVLAHFPAQRHLYSRFERRMISFAVAAHVLVLGCMFLSPVGRMISMWILD